MRSVRLERDEVPSFDPHPFCIPAVARLDTVDLDPSVTFLVGENGSGKSTLIEAVAVAAGANVEGGGRNHTFATRRTESILHRHLVLQRDPEHGPKTDFFFRAESFYNLATAVDLGGTGAYGGRSLHEQSHGESFLATVRHRFLGDGLSFLDEPESALSPQGQLTLLLRMHELVEDGAQFVVATHSPLLLAFPGALVLAVTVDGLVPTVYDDLDHVQLYRSFLEGPALFFHHLFAAGRP